MVIKLTIPGDLPGFNEMLGMSNTHRNVYAEDKKQQDNMIHWLCKSQKLKKAKGKVDVTTKWYCKDRRRDKDNIRAGIKYILDGLQQAGIIKNDGWNEIGNLKDEFYVDKKKPRIEVELTEVE